MAPAALGTDAGGSVRIPAALCAVVGLKPTHGLVPVRGGIGFGNPTVDQIGPLTRTVGDAALLLSLMAGIDPADPTTAAAPRAADYVAAAQAGRRRAGPARAAHRRAPRPLLRRLPPGGRGGRARGHRPSGGPGGERWRRSRCRITPR